ncbi:7-cyano-7-deazaguanine synthase [Mycobacteroides abscessus]|uniref:7-cyano-7-deazaguanine synthase n=1 Tax=Mycobacteroides abscessus TaxID=36809 RepID=UPI001F19D483|nr:7-cyano-7-deazaguanine synthase [Mycobacteroides abscessus]
MGKLGPVRPENVDFVRLALLVFAADRTTPRSGGGSNWSQREFRLRVPVRTPEPWLAAKAELERLLDFLTGDAWTLDFYRARPPKEPVAKRLPLVAPKRAVLLSGGADSAVGAVLSRSQLAADQGHLLLSHVGAKNLAPIQRDVSATAEKLIPGPSQVHLQIGLRRNTKQIDGSPFTDEPSSRSRSLLFLSLGLAAASVDEVPLWIPENGFASLNPPLDPNRRGSLSTRTTHPAFLAGLAQVLTGAGAHGEIHNPFTEMTKGEMFAKAAELVGRDEAAAYLSATHSCGLTGQRTFGLPVTEQCGVCFGCVVRRASFQAAGLQDSTRYIDPDVSTRVKGWLTKNSVERSMQGFLRRGVRSLDLATMSLPPSYPTSVAADLCRRACTELGNYFA